MEDKCLPQMTDMTGMLLAVTFGMVIWPYYNQVKDNDKIVNPLTMNVSALLFGALQGRV